MKTTSVKSIILFSILIMISCYTFAQDDYTEFFKRSIMTNSTGMAVLGGWAIGNITLGAYGWAQYSGQQKYFNQMNLFWNTVNLSIAGFALYKNYHAVASLFDAQEILARHLQTEKILLINSALDIGYIGTGFLLRHLSTRSDQRSELLNGYGKSLILQGGFLFVFDLCLYGILRNQRLDFLDGLNIGILPGLNGFQFVLNM